jgi:CheY-like chemotaxis protein
VGTTLSLLQASAAATVSHAQEMSRLAREAGEALAAKERFLAVMSHEIRTPLNGVLAVAEIIRRKVRQPDLVPFTDTIIESGHTLLRLLNDALDLSRANAAGLAFNEEPLALAKLLDDVVDLWASQAELKGLALQATYDGPPDVWVLADDVRLRQVFNNLIGNALKFASHGRVAVRLSATVQDEYVRVRGEVADTGPGVPLDRLETIFAPFQQTDEGVRRGGAGLGLAVCRQIVERMGGSIAAHPNPGGGALFAFDVPLFRVAEPHAEPQAGGQAAPAERALHVLIADDNATNRLVARSLCEMFGCTSECVEDGAMAVAAAASGRFDMILMDIKMPGMDGVEATRRIRSGPGAVSQIPIVALTANADPADAAFYRSCGMNGVVEKPIKPERLLSAMRAVVDLEDAAAVA